jgi:hypothetical protein
MEWQPDQQAKTLLIRPRKDRHGNDAEGYWLYVFDPTIPHAMAAKEIGVPWRRVVATLLIQESGAYLGEGCDEYEAVIARLDRRLRPDTRRWSDIFAEDPPAA